MTETDQRDFVKCNASSLASELVVRSAPKCETCRQYDAYPDTEEWAFCWEHACDVRPDNVCKFHVSDSEQNTRAERASDS